MFTVYIYVLDTLADWELGYVTAELNSGRFFKKDAPEVSVKTVAISKEPVKTMGGLTIVPDRSIRDIEVDEKAPREELELLLEAGRCAPTSSNSQSVGFTVLDQEFETLRPRIWKSFARLAREGGRKLLLRRYESYLAHPEEPDTLFYGGTQMIAVTSEPPIDGALALANMELMAHALGLGALYCGFAVRAIDGDPDLRAYFGITEKRKLDGCLIVGRTDLRFHRTAPRNPPRVAWK